LRNAPEKTNRGKTPFDIGQELLSGHGAIDGLRRSHATPAQRGHEGDGLPVALRHMPTSRSPRAQRPYSRIILVLADVSSMNTNRAGSNMPVLASTAVAHAPRPRAPGPPRAALFLNVISWRRKNRGATAGDLVSAHHGNHLVQRQVRLLVEQSQQKTPRAPPTARCSRRAAWRNRNML
jgi:hypothetical protein